jgi:hypothetical protein
VNDNYIDGVVYNGKTTGCFMVTRTGSGGSSNALYEFDTITGSTGAASGASGDTSTVPHAIHFYAFAHNDQNNGLDNFFDGTLGVLFIASGWTQTQARNAAAAFEAYETARGNNVLNSTYILDTMSVPAAQALSTRKVTAGYTGSCMLVSRSSDNTSQGVGFVNGDFDAATMDTFVGSSTGVNYGWYDQSGNKIHCDANTNLSQMPTIRTSSTDSTINGHVVCKSQSGNATSMYGSLFTSCTAQPLTFALVAKLGSTATQQLMGDANDNVGVFGADWQINFGAAYITSAVDTSPHCIVFIVNTTGSQIYIDGVQVGSTGNAGSHTPGGAYSPWNFSDANGGTEIAEVFIFPGVMSATDIATYHANCQSYWGTP